MSLEIYPELKNNKHPIHSLSVGPILLTIPQYFTFTIVPINRETLTNQTQIDEAIADNMTIWTENNQTYAASRYMLNFSEIGAANNNLFFRVTIWIYSFILKFVPSIVLIFFTGFLIHALYKAEERSSRLKNRRGNQTQRQQIPQQPPPSPLKGK